jgi:hypothetical protein
MLPPDLVAKLHECATQNFIAARDNWFVWLSRSTKCVVFGLILELPELAYETINFARNRIDRLRYRVLLPEDRLERAKLVAFVGWFLIVAGVAGEWYAGAKIDDLSARIQGCNEVRLAEVAEQSGNANARASAAYERASENEKETAATLKQAEEEREDAAKSLGVTRGYESQIAQANERAANAELETERLRQQLADRTLSDEQVKTIGNKLKLFKGQPYTITAYWDSKESLGLANRIHPALHDVAEWPYSDEGTKSMMLGGIVGVQVWTHPDADKSTKEAAAALIKALNAEGIEAGPKQQNPKNPKTNMIAINVGSKR